MGMSMAAMRPRHSPTQPVSGLLPSLRGGQGLGKDDKGSLDKLESATGMGMGPKYTAPKGPREQGSETVMGRLYQSLYYLSKPPSRSQPCAAGV